jgi:hypothetical protein
MVSNRNSRSAMASDCRLLHRSAMANNHKPRSRSAMASDRRPRHRSAMVNDHKLRSRSAMVDNRKPRSRNAMVDNRRPSSNDRRNQVDTKETMVKETEGMGRAKPHSSMATKKINEEKKTLEVVLRKG